MSLRKLFRRSNNENMSSLTHSKYVPQGLFSGSRTRQPDVDPFKPVYRGKTPLKTSDIVYIEQAPGMLDVHHGQMYQHIGDNPPTRKCPDTHEDLLDKFPKPPGPPPRPPRNPMRTTSLNSHNTPPIPHQTHAPTAHQYVTGRERTIHNSPSVACFSRPTAAAYPSLARKQQRREATADQSIDNVLKTRPDNPPILGSSRQAERVRAKSHTGNSYRPPLPTAPLPRPVIYESRSRANLRRVPSQAAMPCTPSHGHSYWPHANYGEWLKDQNPHTVRAMINRYPVAPLISERLPEHLRPIRFDMNDQRQFQKTLSYWTQIAIAQGRPLDARADGGSYRRIVEAGIQRASFQRLALIGRSNIGDYGKMEGFDRKGNNKVVSSFWQCPMYQIVYVIYVYV